MTVRVATSLLLSEPIKPVREETQVGIFSRGKSKPTFTSYSEKHFREGVHRVLWQDEKLLADGFFEDGPDPIGVEDVMKGMFGGEFTHVLSGDKLEGHFGLFGKRRILIS